MSVKIGRSIFTAEQLWENLKTVLDYLTLVREQESSKGKRQRRAVIPRGWKNIRSLQIKTVDSMALPFYKHLTNEEIQERKRSAAAKADKAAGAAEEAAKEAAEVVPARKKKRTKMS